MKILLVSATIPEIQQVLTRIGLRSAREGILQTAKINNHSISVIIIGVGMTNTAYHLGKIAASKKFDLAINAGIAGSFLKKTPIGVVVNVTEEIFGDLGAEDDTIFRDVFELGLVKKNNSPFKNGILKNKSKIKFPAVNRLLKVKGISVNKGHGNSKSISAIVKKYSPVIESMEGAAFHYVCLNEKIPYIEIRSISNYVEKRDRSKWNIPLAINNLNDFLISLLVES